MLIRKYLLLSGILLGIIIGFSLNVENDTELIDANSNSNQNNLGGEIFVDHEGFPKSSSGTNYDIIEEIFDAKLNQYSTNGYFTQIYEPSLQATYYALYILEALGKLDTINQTAIAEYIISHYNSSTYIFMDKYAYRYLDIDFNKKYYPYTSILEVNCYAILSLAILNNFTSIDTQESINFIWSCYNNVSSGFIGRPYASCPSGKFKTSTMDNTYFAIVTLDLLMDNWDGYSTEKIELVNYINNLQSTNAFEWYFGGFLNDEDTSFDSLGWGMFEPNLLSAYYCVKSLEVFNLEATIRSADFHQYMDGIYDAENYYFKMAYAYHPENHDDIVATALGLQLSDLTPDEGEEFLNSANRTGVINFILNNRNEMGNWDGARQYKYHELIDTFQIIRALKESVVISQLTSNDKTDITNALSNYFNYGGYSLLSNDYVSLELIHAIIESFYIYDRIADISLQGIYNIIRKSCYYEFYYEYLYFSECTNMPYDGSIPGQPRCPITKFRSYPIEYYSLGKRENIAEIGALKDHKAVFMALDSLKKTFKLDDFEIGYNLTEIMNSIIDSQFMESSYSSYGAFLPTLSLSAATPEVQNSEIFFEHSYYAIKSIELIADYLDLGPITDLDFDDILLFNYIQRNIQDDGTTLYFDPQYTDDLEIILQNTYYMIYVLKAIDMYSLDDQKIKNFVIQNLDYTNIKNIYYSYKISEILNLNIDFDVELTYELVQQIYSPDLNEFFLDNNKESIEQEAFVWICDMAKNDRLRIDCQYSDSIDLGTYNNISVSIYNLIVKDFGPHLIVKYESDQIGTVVLDKMPDNSFQKDIHIPVDPNNNPQINGSILVYNGLTLIKELTISFRTTYSFQLSGHASPRSYYISFEYEVSYVFDSGFIPAYNTIIYASILKNNMYKDIKNFTRKDYPEYSRFTLMFIYSGNSRYDFNITLVDGYHEEGLEICQITRYSPSEDEEEDEEEEYDKGSTLLNMIDWRFSIGIGIFLGILLTIIAIVKIKNGEKGNKNSRENGINESKRVEYQDNQKKSGGQTTLANNNANHIKSISAMTNNNKLISHEKSINNRLQESSLINLMKKNKKETLWICLSIIMFTMLYFFETLLVLFLIGGAAIIALGFIILFFSLKKGFKIIGLGGLILCIGVFIFVLKLVGNAFSAI